LQRGRNLDPFGFIVVRYLRLGAAAGELGRDTGGGHAGKQAAVPVVEEAAAGGEGSWGFRVVEE
jgi:hypothetical protein